MAPARLLLRSSGGRVGAMLRLLRGKVMAIRLVVMALGLGMWLPAWAGGGMYSSETAAHDACTAQAVAMGGSYCVGYSYVRTEGGRDVQAFWPWVYPSGKQTAYQFEFYSGGGGCPAGTTADSSGKCVAPPPTNPAKDAAKKKAKDAAAARGLDAGAQAAAEAAAASAWDAWKAAGKSDAEAEAAAVAQGIAAGYDEVYTRYAPDYQAARNACAAQSRDCVGLMDEYDKKLNAAGVNPYQNVTVRTDIPDGTHTEYTQNHDGSWDGFITNDDGKPVKYLGNTPDLIYSPSSGSPGVGSPGPYAQQVPSSGVKETEVSVGQRGGGQIVRYREDGTVEEITYFPQSGGDPVAEARRSPDGHVVCNGCTADMNPGNDIADMSPRAGSGGGGSGTGPTGPLKIDETGTPGNVNAGIGSATGSLDDEAAARVRQLGSQTGVSALPWSFSFSLPSTVCQPLHWSVLGKESTFDPCPLFQRFREGLAYLLYGLAGIYLWKRATSANGGGK